MEQFEYHQTAGLGLRTKAYYVHYKIGLPLSLLNKRQSHRWNANWLNCTLEFSRRKTYLLGGRKTFLFVCLPGVTLKHCFLAGLTLSIDHIFLLWEACFNHILLPLLIQSSRKMVDSYRCSSRSFVLQSK